MEMKMKNKFKLRVPAREFIDLVEDNFSLPTYRKGHKHIRLSVGNNGDLIIRIGGRNFTND
jgi:hypothetical protein